MGLKLVNVLAILVLSLLASTTTSQADVFDVTSSIYGGKPGSDIAEGLAKAWRDACALESASKVVVPSGAYKLKEATFEGPCKAPIEVQIQGTLQAPKDRSSDTWVAFSSIDMLTLWGGGTFDGQGAPGSKDGDIRDIRFSSITNSIIMDITSLDSKKYHISISECTNIVFDHLTITSPTNDANTDGIDIGSSTRINVTHTNIATGDDCIAVGEGTNQLLVTDVTCGPGHGISIGSLGYKPDEKPVFGVTIMNCTLVGTTNGARIKTWPDSPGASTASDILFEDIVMVNVENPIIIDQNYCSGDEDRCKQNTPSEVQISNVRFKNIRGWSATPIAVNLACSPSVPCQNVELEDIDLTYNGNEGSLSSQCFNVRPRTTRVGKALACANLPGLPSGDSPPPPPLYDYLSPMIYTGGPDNNSCWWPRPPVMGYLLISGLGLWLLQGLLQAYSKL
ncbi:polygalacturonase-like [Rosa sericea]